jgi:hypothetical protein
VDVADLFAGGTDAVAVGFLGALHHAPVRHTILDARATRAILTLISEDQRQNLAKPGDRVESGKGLDLRGFGTAGERECDFAQQLIVLSDQGHLDLNRFADPRIREMLRDIFPV